MACTLWLVKAKFPVNMWKQWNDPRQLKMFAFTEPVSASKVRVPGLCRQRTLFVHRRNLLLHDCLGRIGYPHLSMHEYLVLIRDTPFLGSVDATCWIEPC